MKKIDQMAEDWWIENRMHFMSVKTAYKMGFKAARELSAKYIMDDIVLKTESGQSFLFKEITYEGQGLKKSIADNILEIGEEEVPLKGENMIKVGDKVAVYNAGERFVGIVTRVLENGNIILNGGGCPCHPKQCRLIINEEEVE